MSESPYASPPAEPTPPVDRSRFVLPILVAAGIGVMVLFAVVLRKVRDWLGDDFDNVRSWAFPVFMAIVALIFVFTRLRQQRRQLLEVREVDARDALRQLGMAVDDLNAAEAELRATFTETSFIREHLFSLIILTAGAVWALLLVLWAAWPFNALGAVVVALGFAAMIYLSTRYDQRWIELDRDVLRAQHFYTRREAEWPLDDVQAVGFDLKRTRILLSSSRGPLLVNHIDPPMLQGRELVQSLVLRLAQTTQFAAQLRELNGQPLVSCIYRKGTKPPAADRQWNLLLGLAILVALTVATGATYQYSIDYELASLGAVAPHEMKLSNLIAQGPGDNRHVVVTAFEPGVSDNPEERNTSISLPLFPTDKPSDEIEAVLRTDNMPDVGAVYDLLANGRANVICSAKRSEWWGEVAGPNLEKMNGLPLKSAWSLVEISRPPSEEKLSFCFALGLGSFALAAILSVYALWKSV